jgi:hypothetical protein
MPICIKPANQHFFCNYFLKKSLTIIILCIFAANKPQILRLKNFQFSMDDKHDDLKHFNYEYNTNTKR